MSFDFDNGFGSLKFLLVSLLWLTVWLGPLLLFLWPAYYLVSLPLRRQERARIFLDLVEGGLRDRKTAERTLIEVSECRDGSLGRHFHLLAAHLKPGVRLREALAKVPRLLPQPVVAMLLAGDEIGDLRKVLPACRQLLRDGQSHLQSAMNYLVVMAFVITPFSVLVLGAIEFRVLPQFVDVAHESLTSPPAELMFCFQNAWWLLGLQILLILLCWFAAFLYIGGPRLTSWSERWLSPLVNWCQYALPWRRLRMQRDFSAMLGILLDAGLPEPKALTLAADCTANSIFQRRSQRAVAGLAGGMKLTDAVQAMDESGEFRWRLLNACHMQGGFFQSLAGWNESLDARAFQKEQTAAQLATTALVLLNGLIVGTLAVAVFKVLLAIITSAALW